MAKTVGNYTPDPEAVPPEVWADVAGPARRWARLADPRTEKTAYNAVLATSRLAEWLHRTGQSLDDSHALDWRVIDQWAAAHAGALTEWHLRNYRSALRKAARNSPDAPPVPASMKGRNQPRQPPYTPAEVGSLWAWACGLPGGLGRDTRAMLAVSFGAGLDVHDLRHTRSTDVVRLAGGGVAVHPQGIRPRTTVVLAEWEDEVLRLAADGGYLFRPNAAARTASGFASNHMARARNKTPEPVRFDVRRARLTWTVRHLSAGTPVPLLCAALGVKPAALRDLLDHVTMPVLDDGEDIRLLRSPRGTA